MSTPTQQSRRPWAEIALATAAALLVVCVHLFQHHAAIRRVLTPEISALDRPIAEIEIDTAKPIESLQTIARAAGVRIEADPADFKRVVPLFYPVPTFDRVDPLRYHTQLRNITVGSAIRAAFISLDDADLRRVRCEIDGDVIRLSLEGRDVESRYTIAIYDVRDLINQARQYNLAFSQSHGAPPATPPAPGPALCFSKVTGPAATRPPEDEDFSGFVVPGAWPPGYVASYGGLLFVRQSPESHRQTRQILELLRALP